MPNYGNNNQGNNQYQNNQGSNQFQNNPYQYNQGNQFQNNPYQNNQGNQYQGNQGNQMNQFNQNTQYQNSAPDYPSADDLRNAYGNTIIGNNPYPQFNQNQQGYNQNQQGYNQNQQRIQNQIIQNQQMIQNQQRIHNQQMNQFNQNQQTNQFNQNQQTNQPNKVNVDLPSFDQVISNAGVSNSNTNIVKHMQFHSLGLTLGAVFKRVRNTPNVDMAGLDKIIEACRNYSLMLTNFDSRVNNNTLAPNYQQLTTLRKNLQELSGDYEAWFSKLKKNTDVTQEALFYAKISLKKMKDDLAVLSKMQPGMSISDACTKFSVLGANYGENNNGREIDYIPEQKNDKNKPEDTLQIFTVAYITNELLNLVKDNLSYQSKQEFNKIVENLQQASIKAQKFNIVSYKESINPETNTKEIKRHTTAIDPKTLSEYNNSIGKAIKDLEIWSQKYCFEQSAKGEDHVSNVLFLTSLVTDKLTDDYNVTKNMIDDQTSIIPDAVDKYSELPKDYGVKEIDGETKAIEYKKFYKKSIGNLGEYYSFNEDGFNTVISDIHNLYEDSKAADPKWMLGSPEYRAMKTSLGGLESWITTFKDSLSKNADINDHEHQALQKLLANKIDDTMTKVHNYLVKKEADINSDISKGKDRVNDATKQKREQPRIRTAFHIYERLIEIRKICPNNNEMDIERVNRDAKVADLRSKIMSESSKQLFSEENKPKKQAKQQPKAMGK
ncbi:MAG: hypothetical protein K5656_02400 [Lachnospiraceae bacterium]|nr:hypothetical protein [Lachnospiraceae bacterium]